MSGNQEFTEDEQRKMLKKRLERQIGMMEIWISSRRQSINKAQNEINSLKTSIEDKRKGILEELADIESYELQIEVIKGILKEKRL